MDTRWSSSRRTREIALPFRFGLTPLLLLGALFAGACNRDTPFDPAPDLRQSSASGGLTATAVSYSQIDLAWLDNASNESGWEVHRSTTGAGGAFTLWATTNANLAYTSDRALLPLTQYCYKVRSYKMNGRRVSYGAFSNVACATTPASPAPPPPTGVTAAPLNGYAIRVDWTDVGPDETGYRLERGTSANGPWSVIASTGLSATGYEDQGFGAAEQPVCYRVIAFNQVGDSEPSVADCTAMPAAPRNLQATATGLAIALTWTDSSAVEDGYQISRTPTYTGGYPVTVGTLPANATSFGETAPAGEYLYRVVALKDGGTSASAYVRVVAASAPPAAPTDLSVFPTSSRTIQAWWTDASNNEEGFRLERSLDGGLTWAAAPTSEFNVGLDTLVTAEQQVCYRAIAYNSVGESAPSNTDCTTAPAGPTGFAVAFIDSETVRFTWTDNSAAEDGYELVAIDCFSYEDCYMVTMAVLPPNTTSYQVGSPGAFNYSFMVRALKDGGWSDWSEERTPAAPGGSP